MPPITTQSSAPDVALALKTGLLAQLTTDGLMTTQVVIGPPAPAVLNLAEFVAIEDAEIEVSVRALNATTQPRDERYKQELLISVVAQTIDDSAVAEARAFAIYQSLETLLRAKVRLEGYYAGPGALYHVKPTRIKFSRRAEEMRREAALEVELDVHARL